MLIGSCMVSQRDSLKPLMDCTPSKITVHSPKVTTKLYYAPKSNMSPLCHYTPQIVIVRPSKPMIFRKLYSLLSRRRMTTLIVFKFAQYYFSRGLEFAHLTMDQDNTIDQNL